jgi:hypothetical protein
MSVLEKYAHILNSAEEAPDFGAAATTTNADDDVEMEDRNGAADEMETDAPALTRASLTFDQPIEISVNLGQIAVDEDGANAVRETRNSGNGSKKGAGKAKLESDSFATVIVDAYEEFQRQLNKKSHTNKEQPDEKSNATGKASKAAGKKSRFAGKVSYQEDDYDIDDPFIDDEDDYAIEQIILRPKINGYFVWKGAVPSVEVTNEQLQEMYDAVSSAAEEQEKEELEKQDTLPLAAKDDAATVTAAVDADASVGVVEDNANNKKRQISELEVPTSQTTAAFNDDVIVPDKDPAAARKKIQEIFGSVKKKQKKSVNNGNKVNSMDDFDMSKSPFPDKIAPSSIEETGTIKKPTFVSSSVPVSASVTAASNDEAASGQKENQGVKAKIKRPRKPPPPLPEIVQKSMDKFKAKCEELEFTKGKLPHALVDPLKEVTKTAIDEFGGRWETLNAEDNKHFWAHLKDILPYQISALKKLVDRLILPQEMNNLETDLDGYYIAAQAEVKVCLELSEKSHEQKLEKWKSENPDAILDEDGVWKVPLPGVPEDLILTGKLPATFISPDVIDLTDGLPSSLQQDSSNSKQEKPKENKAPVKKLTWSTELRMLVYKIIQAETQLMIIKKRIKEIIGDNTLKKPPASVEKTPLGDVKIVPLNVILPPDHSLSEHALRRQMYHHIYMKLFVPLGADNYLNTSEIGRQYNTIRSKEVMFS